MSQTIKDDRLTTGDWYEMACDALAALQRESSDYADDDEIVPSDDLFKAVKSFFDVLRESDVRGISVPQVWHSPDGELGVSWLEKGAKTSKRVDVLFASPTQMAATLRMQGKQKKATSDAETIELLRSFAA